MPFFPSLPTARGLGGDSIPTLLPYGQCVSCFLLRGVRRLFSDSIHVISSRFSASFRREVTERTRGALAALHPARLSRRPRCREFRARADARGRSPERHARDGRDRREVRRRARAAMRFFASPAIWRHDALFDPSNARDETRVGANAPPATARTSDPRCPTPSSRKRRCAPTARGGYPRVRGGPHLAGACPDASPTPPEATIPSKPLTNCRCSRTFPSASSRRVTLRHCARPPSARPR